MPVKTHPSLRLAACLSVALLLAGCSGLRAREALNAYQAATASNDVLGARDALLKLVQAKDDVSDYWIALGKVQASLGNFNDAYYAFTRAYELDRTNVDVLRSVTQLALRSGDLPSAKAYAEQLSVLSPGDSSPKLVTGWVAVREFNFPEALAAADGLLANSPYDPSATVLKAQALLGLNRDDDAVETLLKQVRSQPSDTASLDLLARIYEQHGDWGKLFPIMAKLAPLTPERQKNALLLIEAGFRSGHDATARDASLRLLQRSPDPALIQSVLELWQDYWPSPQRIIDERSLAAHAPGLNQKLVYGRYLSRAGSPADAVRLSSRFATLPVNADNAEANAVLADALWRLGNITPAKIRLNAVLAFDPGNATALLGRSELELRTGNAAAAIIDAQKLVTVLPNSAPARVLLARSFSASNNDAWAERTLWQAFQDIPGDETIFAALQARRKSDPEASAELQREYQVQRNEKLRAS